MPSIFIRPDGNTCLCPALAKMDAEQRRIVARGFTIRIDTGGEEPKRPVLYMSELYCPMHDDPIGFRVVHLESG